MMCTFYNTSRLITSLAPPFYLATLPVTIDCAVGAGASDGVARFCIPLGATINMDGGAIYIICAAVWLAYNNGIVPTAGDYILLVICAVSTKLSHLILHLMCTRTYIRSSFLSYL